MLFLIPYSSDVAGDFRPVGTVGLILVNILVALLLGHPDAYSPDPPWINTWVLEFGTVNPLTWITSAFTHLDFFHIVFNMIFLWIFGLVVEGYLGWRRFLLLYLVLAAAGGAITQILMLGGEKGGAMGASGAIFGLMAIAALWAPRNRFICFVWIITIVKLKADLSVLFVCLFYLCMNIFFAMLAGFRMSSEVLHLIGGVVGLAAGVTMLKKKWVDTEGWDYLAIRAGRTPRAVIDPSPLVLVPDSPELHRDTLVRIRDALDAGDGLTADELYAGAQRVGQSWHLPQEDHRKLIQELLRRGGHERAAERMEEFLRLFPQDSAPMRLTLARLHLEMRRPGRALAELAALDGERLTERQQSAKAELEERARTASSEPGLELE